MQIIGHCINCTIQPKILDFLKVGFKKYIPKIALDGSSEGFWNFYPLDSQIFKKSFTFWNVQCASLHGLVEMLKLSKNHGIIIDTQYV